MLFVDPAARLKPARQLPVAIRNSLLLEQTLVTVSVLVPLLVTLMLAASLTVEIF